MKTQQHQQNPFKMKDNTKLIAAFKTITGIQIPLDMELSFITKTRFEIDIFKLDELLGSRDSEYDNENATYKGRAISMNEYIGEKYGGEAFSIINQLV